MDHNIRKNLVAWANIKNKIPKENNDKDPFYRNKLILLYEGNESLGDKTYKEWSEEVGLRLASTFKEADPSPLDEDSNSLDILTMLIHTYAYSELSEENQTRRDDSNELDDIIQTAFVALRHTIEYLGWFIEEYLIWHFDERSKDNGKESYEQVEKCLSIIEKLYTPAIKGICEDDLKPFRNLCEVAFSTILNGGVSLYKDKRGSQHRKAAHKKMNQTGRLGNMPLNCITKSHGKTHALRL